MSELTVVKYQQRQDYASIFKAMKQHEQRQNKAGDELWLLEHMPVYTLGKAASREHLLNTKSIEVVRSDRGGQATYHGPGQLMAYTLFNLQALGIGIRSLVTGLENSIIDTLNTIQIDAYSQKKAPGVYVNGSKIASVGLRLRHGCCYHGIALNVDMDLKPFEGINPCGFENLKMVQCASLSPGVTIKSMAQTLSLAIKKQFNYTHIQYLKKTT